MNTKSLRTPALLMIVLAPHVYGLPTMIRLGYPNCSSCHIAPQGAGLLTRYGRSVDQAQSLRGGEYVPWESAFCKIVNLDGRIVQDVRTVLQQQDVSTTGKPGTQILRGRFIYRNSIDLGKGFRVGGMITGENSSAPRPSLAYEGPARPDQLFVNTAMLSYRARPTLEFSAGRDQLPTGVNIADLTTFVRARNKYGYYDSPTQAKAFWWSKRYLIAPYAYGPGGNELKGQHENGEGIMAEFDVRGKQKTVVGLNLLHGTDAAVDRTMAGPYIRLGFGQWGILAEHDITNRSLKTATRATSFGQAATYGQIFWAAREWLVPSLIVERLRVDRPYRESLNAAKLELAARLGSQLTVTAGPRIQRDEISSRISRSVVFQLAMKTVH